MRGRNLAVRCPRARGRMSFAAAGATFAALVVTAVPSLAATPSPWKPAQPMNFATAGGVAAPLANGDVLIAGGSASGSGSAIKSSQIYDPATDSWTNGPDMGTARYGGAGVAIAGGKVLAAGGSTSVNPTTGVSTGEVYSSGTWTAVTNTMQSPHTLGGAAVLSSGKVLIVGGTNAAGNADSTADLYDPATNAFSHAHAMNVAHGQYPLVTTLANGEVLVAGGQVGFATPLDSGELYNPATDTWTAVANSMSSPRTAGAIAPLPGNRALLAGGVTVGPSQATTATTEIYSAATNTFSPGPSMATGKALFGMTVLPNGDVLEAGGVVFGPSPTVVADSQLYTPATNSWSSAGSLPAPAAAAAMVPLPGGRALEAGGIGSNVGAATNQASVFTPPTPPTAPQAVSASAGNGSAQVTFAPPASDGGLPILHYTVTASTGQTASTTDTRTFATVSGLTNGRSVTFTVTAVNALGAGSASAPSNAVTPLGPDRAPTLKVTGLPSKLKLKLKAFLKGLKFSVTPDKPASLQLSLLATVNKATIARAFNLTLASKSLRSSSRKQNVTLVPSKKLVGHPRKATIELVIVATDAAGSRSTTTKKLKISG